MNWPVGPTGRSGYIDTTGKWVIKPTKKYSSRGSFSEGLAAVSFGPQFISELQKWGYINTNEKLIIKPQFNSAGAFSEGLADVRVGNKKGYIDKKGRLVIPCQFDDAFRFHNGYATVQIDNRWGLIDRKGRFKIKPISESSLYFRDSSELSAYKIDRKYGFIDFNGNIIIEPKFEIVDGFSEGVAMVSSDRAKAAFINAKGDTVIPTIFSIESRNFQEGLAPVTYYGSRTFFYINKKGEKVFDKTFSHAEKFENGLAIIINDRKYGVINRSGEYVLQPAYTFLSQEKYNLFRIGIMPDSVINMRAKIIWRYDPKQNPN